MTRRTGYVACNQYEFPAGQPFMPRTLGSCGARALLAIAFLTGAHAALAFDFDDVAALARRKARAPYEPQDRAQPQELELLGYDRVPRHSFSPGPRDLARRRQPVRPDVLPPRAIEPARAA